MTARIALAVLALAVSTGRSVAQELPRFRLSVDAVQVNVQVDRANRPVTGLATANFELRDSGVSQKIDVVAMEDVPVHLLLALDTSSSVRGALLAELKEATRVALASLHSEDRVTLLTFSDDSRLLADGTADRDAAARAIAPVEARGWTSLQDAVFQALLLPPVEERRAVLVVFSDGRDTASWLGPDALLESARRGDTVVYAVSRRPPWEIAVRNLEGRKIIEIRERARKWFTLEPRLFRELVLPQLAEDTGGRVYYTGEDLDLRRLFAEAVAEFKSGYLLSYVPRGVPADGWHPIDVKLKGAKGDVTARRGYQR